MKRHIAIMFALAAIAMTAFGATFTNTGDAYVTLSASSSYTRLVDNGRVTYIFTNPQTLTMTLKTGVTGVRYLIAGGGGGGGWGGSQSAGAGGAGGMVSTDNIVDQANGTAIAITVGAGGAGGTSSSDATKRGSTGGNSTIKFGTGSTFTAKGGGGGGGVTSTQAASAGGSSATGGGGAGSSGGAGKGGVGTLYNGAGAFSAGTKGGYIAGGGAGAGGNGEVGVAQENRGGNGGIGVTSDITGTSISYGGGGGAGACTVADTTRPSGNAVDSWYPGTGTDGGGTGGHSKGIGSVLTLPEAGADGRGGGGGGGLGGTAGEPLANAKIGGKGGSGTVIVSFMPTATSAFCDLGAPVVDSRTVTLSAEFVSSVEWQAACGYGLSTLGNEELAYRDLGAITTGPLTCSFSSLLVDTDYKYAFRFINGTTTNYFSSTFHTLPIHGIGGKMTVLANGEIVHVFDEPGTWTFNPPAGTVTAQILLVGGGGGGGGNSGGGGGAGGMVELTRDISFGNAMTIEVGAGGDGGADSVGGNGDRSSVIVKSGTGIISAYGGGGGGYSGSHDGASGGCGGGGVGTGGAAGATIQTAVIDGATSHGQAGGSGNGGSGYEDLGGGGGGAGGTGTSATGSNTYNGGAGGAGFANDITGTSVTYAGGGGGAANYSNHSDKGSGGAGGAGGGGVGAKGNWRGDLDGGAGTDGLGAGGGGGAAGGKGGKGGSGVVVVRYTPVTDELTVVAHHGDMTASSVDLECLLTSTGDGSPAVILYLDYSEKTETWEPVWSDAKIVSDYFQPGEDHSYSNTIKGLHHGTEYQYCFMVSNVNSGVCGETRGSFKTMLMPPDAPEADFTWHEADSTYIVDCHGTNYVTTYDGFTSASVRYFIAGGGGGGAAYDGFVKGGGGSGGGTAEGTFTLNYGDTIEYQVGMGGTSDAPGGETWIKVNGTLVARVAGGAKGAPGGNGGDGATAATGLPGADGTTSDITATVLAYGAGGGAANGATGGSGGVGGRGGVANTGSVGGGDGVRGSGGGGGASDGYDGTVYASFTNQNSGVWHYITACWNSETLLARCLDCGAVLVNGEKALPGASYPSSGIAIGGYLTGDDKSFSGEFRELRLSTAYREDGWQECEAAAAQTNFARFGATTTVNHHYDLDCAGMAVTTNLLGTVESNGTFNAELVGLDSSLEYHTRLLLTDAAGNTSVLPRRYSDPLTADAPLLTARRMSAFSGTAAVTESIAVTVTNVTLNAADEPETFHLEFTPTHRKFWLFAAYGAFDQGTDHKKWAYWEPVAEIAADVDGYDAPAPAGFNEKWRAIRFYAVEWIAPGAMVLDYVSTTGAQWVDPEFKPDYEDIRVWMDVVWLQDANSSNQPILFGVDSSGDYTVRKPRFVFPWNGYIYCGSLNSQGGTTRYAAQDATYEVWTTGRKLYWKYNGGSTQGGNSYNTTSSSGKEGTARPYLLAYNGGDGTASRMPKVRLYGCKLWDNEVLKRDFVACRKDGVVQLYDRVSERFFPSNSTTPFNGGNELGDKYVGDNYGSSASWCDYDSEKAIEVADVVKVNAGTRPAQYKLKVATDKALLVYAVYGANDHGTEYKAWPNNEFVGAVYAGSVTNLIFTAPAGFNQSWRAVKFFAKEWIAPGATVLDGATSTNGQWIDTQFCSKHEAQGAIVDVTLRERFYNGNTIGIYGIQYAPNGSYSTSRFIFGYNANIHCGNQGPRMGDFAAGSRYKFDIYTTASKVCYWKVSGAANTSSSFSYANSSCYNQHLTAALYGYMCNYSCGQFTKMTLHSAQIFDDGVMMRDYIPVLKDGEAQLYDKVEKKYYKSMTATPLVAENVVSEYYPGDVILESTETWKEFEGFGEVAILSVQDAADGKPAKFIVRVSTDDFAGLRLSMAYGAIPGGDEKDTWAYVENIGDYPQGVTDVEVTAPSGFGTRWNDLKFYTEGFWIPPDAQEVEYIQSNGSSYFNTEVLGTSVYGVRMGLQEHDGPANGTYYLSSPGFCFYVGWQYGTAVIQLYSQGSDRSWGYIGNNANSALRELAFVYDSSIGTGALTYNGSPIQIDNQRPVRGPCQPIDKIETKAIHFFRSCNAASGIPSARCSYLKFIGSDGNLVANMVPCVWNGVPMMFDTVRRKAYPSESATPFVAGPAKSEQRVSAGASTEVWRRYTPQKPDAGTQQGSVIITEVKKNSKTGAPQLIYLKFPQPHDQMALYMCWGWNGISKDTNGWDNVKFMGYIRPATGMTIVNAPSGYGTTWSNIRFVTYRYLGQEWYDLKYVSSNRGTTYLDLGVKESDVYGLDTAISVNSVLGNYNSLLAGTLDNFTIGHANGNTSHRRIYLRHRGAERYNGSNQDILYADQTTAMSVSNRMVIADGKFTVNGTDRSTTVDTTGSLGTGEANIHLFNNAALSRPTDARCFYLKFYDQQGFLVNDFVPRMRYDENEGLDAFTIGLYDRMNGAFIVPGEDMPPLTADKSGADIKLIGNSLGYSQLWPVMPLALDYSVTLSAGGVASVSAELASLGADADQASISLVIGHPTGDPDAEIKEVTLNTATGHAVTNFVRVGDAIPYRTFKVTFPNAPEAIDFRENVPVLLHFEENQPATFSFADCPSGEGIRVYLNGEELPVDVAYWNENGSGEVYVLVPELSKNVELDVVWYPDAEEAPVKTTTSEELWQAAGYFAVYHASNRADPTAALVDSSTNKLHAAVVGTCRVITAEQLVAAGITESRWSGLLTLSAWAKPQSDGADCRILSSGRNFVEGFNCAVRKSGMWMMSDGRFMGELEKGSHIGAGGRGGDGVVLLRYTPEGEMSEGPWVKIFNDTSSRKGIWLGFDYNVLWPGQGADSVDLDFLWGPTEDNLDQRTDIIDGQIGSGDWFYYDLLPGTNWYYAVEATSSAGTFTSRVHSVSFAGPAVVGDVLCWQDDENHFPIDIGRLRLNDFTVTDRGIGSAKAYLRYGFKRNDLSKSILIDLFDCASEEPLVLGYHPGGNDEAYRCAVHTQIFYCVEVSNYWAHLDYWMVTNTTVQWTGAWVLNEDRTTLTDGTGWKFAIEMDDDGRGVKLQRLTGVSEAYDYKDDDICANYQKHLDFDDPIVDENFNYGNGDGNYYFYTLGQALMDQIRDGGKDPGTKTVSLPEDPPLTFWDNGTFRNCMNLEFIENWPKSMKKVPDETLYNCSMLSYNIMELMCSDTEEIGWNAYAQCPMLWGTLEMPVGITNLYSGFRGDIGLMGVNATNVWALSGDTFADCTGLQWAHFSTNRPLVSVGYFLNDYALSDFLPRPLPVEVRELPDYFLMNCYRIPGFIEDFLPTNLCSIGESAFEECGEYDAGGVHHSVSGSVNLVSYAALTNLSPRAFYDCRGIDQAVMPAKSLREIGHEAFFGCASITNVELNLVDYIGYGAFAGLSTLSNVWFTNMRRNTYLDNSEMEVFSGSDDVAFHYHSKLPVVGYPNQPCFVSEGGTNSMPYRFIIYSERKVEEWMALDQFKAYNEKDFIKATETSCEPVKGYRLQGVYLDAAGGSINRHLLIGPERPTRIHER